MNTSMIFCFLFSILILFSYVVGLNNRSGCLTDGEIQKYLKNAP